MSTLLGHCVRNINRTVTKKWRSRLLASIPKTMTEFETTVSYRGIKLFVDTSESVGRSIFFFHDYESAQESAFVELASKRKVFDIGANIGIFSLLAAWNGATVVAFEPSKRIRPMLEKNVTLNKFSKGSDNRLRCRF
jgi:23S rRNA G2069 N7-methylase RlmK/C1962 C5-methylase RlmI